jgi:hypothetical protein
MNHLFQISFSKSGFEDVQLYGQSTRIPARIINTTDVVYFGQTFELPTTIDEGRRWPVEFNSDKDNDLYNKFLDWQQEYASLINSGGGFKGVSPDNAYIDILNQQLTDVADSFTLAGIIPLEVGEEVLDNSAGGDLVTFSVEFLFQYKYNTAYLDPVR